MGDGTSPTDVFAPSRLLVAELMGWMAGDEACALEHSDLESQLGERGRGVLRQMFDDQMDLRALREPRVRVTAGDGAVHGTVEAGHQRPLVTVFGAVSVTRFAYRRRGRANLYPADAALNLPVETHSHGLRRLAAVESARGSFDEAAAALERSCGTHVAKRQVEAMAARSAVDFEAFYASRRHDSVDDGDVLVMSCDGKGIKMLPGELRPATAKAAAASHNKLEGRLSKGEKRNRKRMAEVATVYDIKPVARSADDIMSHHPHDGPAPKAPKAANKWSTASVADDAAVVVAQMFDEAQRRDPEHSRVWVALLDGNNHQIDRVKAEAAARHVKVTIVCDFVHVLEYLWAAAWSFYAEGDPAAQTWVAARARQVLAGHAKDTAAAIRRKATILGLDTKRRAGADDCATYLTNKAPYLDYRSALNAGWPIASGVIEGACRYLVKDRLDITGARWSVDGAEAVLKLRALRANNDFDEYYTFHLAQERRRIHNTSYAEGRIPLAA